MEWKRSCGILLHPTSFPSNFGIGDLGENASVFLDFLKDSGQSLWQILPLGPTGYGNSPYASYSAFAGNPYLISPDILHAKELLARTELEEAAIPSSVRVDYPVAMSLKDGLFHKASQRFYERKDSEEQTRFERFREQQKEWLDDYVLFMALLKRHGQQSWSRWEKPLAQYEKKACEEAAQEHADILRFQYWLQFEFSEQWNRIRENAREKNIRIIGDIPIFVDHNSSDVWANRLDFEVDEAGNSLLVAGVPPDYFSETGQLWGNPLYRWSRMEESGYHWWVRRFARMFELCDAIRVDHFRGFDAFWEIRAGEKTAQKGRWVKGPGEKLFLAIEEKLGKLPIIAEDLGVITPSVETLRDRFEFPGMKVLHFAFDDPSNPFLPHNYRDTRCVVFSGTHDNDTTRGWYHQAPESEKHYLRRYTHSDGSDVHMQLIRLGMMSIASMAIFPLQDYLGLGSEHRMNYPGTSENNWEWRYTQEMLEAIDRDELRDLARISNRLEAPS